MTLWRGVRVVLLVSLCHVLFADEQDPACNAGYWGWDATFPSCHACAQGKYKDFVGQAMWCHSCPQNKHTLLPASATPLSCTCNHGYTGPLGLDECAPCSSAEMAGLVPTALSQCALCAQGYYTGSGAHLFQRCASCQPGYHRVYAQTNVCAQCPGCTLIVGFCPANRWKLFQQSTCEPCPAHSSSPAGSQHITDCLCQLGDDNSKIVTVDITCSGVCPCPRGVKTGVITDGPGDYTPGVQCTWILHSNAMIVSSLTSFDTEESADYLIISRCNTASCDDIVTQDNPISGTGQSLVNFYTFSTRKNQQFMKIEFVTDGRINKYRQPKSGFSLSWTIRDFWWETTSLFTCNVCGAGKYLGAGVCVDCAAGKYSSALGAKTSAVCMNCPAPPVSPVGSSRFENCVLQGNALCGRNHFQVGGCTPCPLYSSSYPGTQFIDGCTCDVGAKIDAAVTVSQTCSGSCTCEPSTSVRNGIITDGPEPYSSYENCKWVIESTAIKSIQFSSLDLSRHNDKVTIRMCANAICSCGHNSPTCDVFHVEIFTSDHFYASGATLANTVIQSQPGYNFLVMTFTSEFHLYSHTGFHAVWWTSGPEYKCSPCGAGKYVDAGVCTDCVADTYSTISHANSSDTCLMCPGLSLASAGSTAETNCTYDDNIWCPSNEWQALIEAEKTLSGFERCGPCPPYSSAPKGTKFISACACDNKVDVAAGVIASVTCSGHCECTDSSSAVKGYITDGPGDQSVKSNCKWLFASNAKIHLKFLTSHHPGDFITISLCMTALCDKDRQLIIRTDFLTPHLGLSIFETTTDYPFLQVIFTSGSVRTGVGFRAEWFTSGSAYSCMQCEMGQYSAVDASTRQDECVSCVAGKYSQVTGGATSAVCTSCPSGMYSSTVGATVCRSCAPGQRSRTDRMGCVMLDAPPACSEAVHANVSCAHSACECLPTSGTASGFVSDGPLWSQPGDCSWTISAQVAPSVISVHFPQFWIDLHYEHVKLYQCSDAKCTSRQQIVSLYGMREPMHLKSILSPDTTPDRTDVVYTSSTGHLQVVAHLFYEGLYPGFVAAWSARMSECNCAAGFTGACAPCGQGTYKTGTGNAACTRCVAGKNSLQEAATSPLVCSCDAGSTGNNGLAACTFCEPGKYKARNGSAPCTDCPAGSHSTETGDIWGQACACNAGFSGAHPVACVRCVAGKYKSWIGFGSCTNCSEDTYSEEVGAASHYTCMQCPLNSISPAGSGSSFACSCITGYTGVHSPSACVACAHGKFKSEHGPMACQDCPLDTFSSALAAKTNAQCFCNAGFSGPPAGPCAQCAPGKYKSAMGSVSCALCPASTYSQIVGATSLQVCGACRANRYSPEGSVTEHDCACIEGYQGYPGGRNCEQCGWGKYKGYVGSVGCTSCPAVKFNQLLGATSEESCTCNRGYTGAPGLGACTACTPGKFASIESPNQCTDCLPCFHSTTDAAHTCIFCVQGKQCTVNKVCECKPGSTGPHGTDQCSTCARGTYKAGAGSAACDECGTDRNTAVTGATSIAFCECNPGSTGKDGNNQTCTLCSLGYFKNVSGPAICTACTRDTYSTSAGVVQCTACNTGKTTLFAAATNEAFCLCRAGTTGADGAAACAQCSPGKHKAVHGSADCSACGESTYSAGFGNVQCTGCVLGKSSTAIGAATDADCTCDPGTTGANGAETCSQCAPGKHKAVSGNATCENCAHSKYAASPGALHCTSCPGGKSSTTDGATSHAECMCDAGSTGADGGAACSPCNQGRYKAAKGSADCTQCVLGKSTLSAGASSDSACTCDAGLTGSDGISECVKCAAGTYKAEPGPHNCTQCAENQHTQLGAIACVCNAGHTAHGPACSACVAGKYKQGTGSHACTPCAAGQHSAAVGASANPCAECSAGSYSADDSTHCVLCRNHSHSSPGSASLADCVCNAGHEAASCSACVAGKYKQGTGSHACTPCAAGQHSAAVGASANPCAECAAGSYSADDSTHCVLCRNHSHSSPGSASVADCVCNAGHEAASCSACVAGKYKQGTGSLACTLCAAGQHSAAVGASDNPCTECAAGSYSAHDSSHCEPCRNHSHSSPGSADAADCVCNAGYEAAVCSACVAGKYKSQPGSGACVACAPGKFAASVGARADICTNCPAGSYASGDNSRCVPCPPYSFSAERSVDVAKCACNAGWTGRNGQCVGCAAGKYKLNPGRWACIACGPGKAMATPNSSKYLCVDCEAGSYAATDRSQCVPCRADSHSVVERDDPSHCLCNAGWSDANGKCVGCVAGKYKIHRGPLACTDCAAGKYLGSVNASSDGCTDCQEGSFSAPDKQSCIQCPPNSSSPAGSDTKSACVCAPGRSGATCESCAAGKHTTLGAPCRDCDPGKFSPAPGSASCAACPPGSSNALPASTTCTCEPGFTGTPCASCPADSYKHESGAHACTSCPAASFVVFPHNTLLSDCKCQAGKYLREIPD